MNKPSTTNGTSSMSETSSVKAATIMNKVSRIIQGLLLFVVTIGILWFGITNGTGIVSDTTRSGENIIQLENYTGEGHRIMVSYEVPPKRVLITYPGATELLIVLGLQNRIVATMKPYGVEPPELAGPYDALPKLEAPFVPTKEEVLQEKPDLVMAWNHHFLPNALGDVRYWHKRDIATYIVPATVRKGSPTMEGTVFPFIDNVGAIFGVPEEAARYKESLADRIAAVRQDAVARGTTPTVMVLQLYGNSMYTVYGENYIVYDIVRTAGGQPLVPQGMSFIGPERILGVDPDYIVLVMTDYSGNMETFTEEGMNLVKADPNIRHMRAIEAGRVIPVPFGAINNGNGRVVDALEMISAGLNRN